MVRFSSIAACALATVSFVVGQNEVPFVERNAVPLDFSITHTNVSTEWNQREWELATYDFAPHRYQARMSLANG